MFLTKTFLIVKNNLKLISIQVDGFSNKFQERLYDQNFLNFCIITSTLGKCFSRTLLTTSDDSRKQRDDF